MGEAKRRKVHTPEFKAKVGLEALRGVKMSVSIQFDGLMFTLRDGCIGRSFQRKWHQFPTDAIFC